MMFPQILPPVHKLLIVGIRVVRNSSFGHFAVDRDRQWTANGSHGSRLLIFSLLSNTGFLLDPFNGTYYLLLFAHS